MVNDIPPDIVVNTKSEYYLDPYFFGKAANKGELLQCFSKKNKPLTYKDIPVNQDSFYEIRAQSNKKIVSHKGVPVEQEVLKVFQLKSFPIITILLKIAIHKQLSIGKCQQLYKQTKGKFIQKSDIIKKLSTQKALCVQMTDHILQIAYGKEAGLVLADGSPWKPQPTQQQKDSLTKARETKELKHTFLPVPEDFYDKVATALKDSKEYFDDIDFERKLNIERTKQEEVCASIELKSFGEIYNKG